MKRRATVEALIVGLGLGLGVGSVGCSGSESTEMTQDALQIQQKELQDATAANDAAAKAAGGQGGGGNPRQGVMPP